jgi:uncharacterized linocin/CFP29 family protein
MNNLYRELAPVSDEAWADLSAEVRRTFIANLAARRAVDVIGPAGADLAAVNTGHLATVDSPGAGVHARLRQAQALVELRAPFDVSRHAVDDVGRGARDADWQPAKEAARRMAFAEDGTVFDGFAAAGVAGIRAASSNPAVALPQEVRDYPNAVAQALTTLRLAGVAGPYVLLLSADAYTAVSETSDHGYPVREHVARVIGDDGEIGWAPALRGGLVLSARGGDFELHLGEDLAIGYLHHDAETVTLYLQETLTFLVQTAEAAVTLTAG